MRIMRTQFLLQCLLVFVAVGSVASHRPLAQDGLGTMRDLFGGMGGAANQGMGAMGGAMGGLGDMLGSGMGGLGGMLQQIMQAWGSIMSQLMNGGGDTIGQIFNMIKGLFENFFKIFGSLSGGAQSQISGMYQKSGTVFASVMKLKLNPEKNSKKLEKEVQAVRKLLESKHQSPEQLVKAIKTKAPQITSAMKLAFAKAKQEYNKHWHAMHPEAKKGVQTMHLQVAKAKLDLGGLLGSIMGMGGNAAGAGGNMLSGMMSMGMNLLQNLFSLFQMFMPH